MITIVMRIIKTMMITMIYKYYNYWLRDSQQGEVLYAAERPVGVAQLDDRQLPARGIVHAHSPCFCSALPRCYCISNFTYVQSDITTISSTQLHALASSTRLQTRQCGRLMRSLACLYICLSVVFILNACIELQTSTLFCMQVQL